MSTVDRGSEAILKSYADYLLSIQTGVSKKVISNEEYEEIRHHHGVVRG